MNQILFTIVLLFSLQGFAHEGDHGPSTVAAPKGGVIRTLETVHLELVTQGKDIRIFLYDHDMKSADPKKYPITATVTLPRKKPSPLSLEAKTDHWFVHFDPKNAHRFDIEISIAQGGHMDKVKWTIEPTRN